MNEAPVLKVNMAMTLDGKVMLPDGKWHGLTSAGDRHRMDLYRTEADALIVGSQSVIQDNPVVVPRNVGAGRTIPRAVMLCRSALPGPELRMFADASAEHRPLLFIDAGLENELGALADVAEVESFESGTLTPRAALDRLRARGLPRVLLEGGPRLNYAFFQEDLVDVLYFTMVPFMIGSRELPGLVDGPDPFNDFRTRMWDLHRAHTIGNEVFFEYRRARDRDGES